MIIARPLQAEKAQAFKALHERPGCFVIPNAWNGGTAKILTDMGFEALATTSAGLAFSLGRRDAMGQISLRESLDNAREIMSTSHLPVTGDLESGYSATAEGIAETIMLAAGAGLVGCSVEDATGDDANPIYDIGLAKERIQMAVETARTLPFPFLITARAENFIYDRPNLKDTIKRLQSFQEAGADVLFAPGIRLAADITAVLSEIDRPLHVIMGGSSTDLTLSELSNLGVKRVSVGSALSRVAFGAFITAAMELKTNGSFQFADQAIGYKKLNSLF